MTWKELLGLGPDEWKTITDDELIKILQPFFKVTRPDLSVKKPEDFSSAPKKQSATERKAQAGGRQLSFDVLHKELMRQATLAGVILPNQTPPPKK